MIISKLRVIAITNIGTMELWNDSTSVWRFYNTADVSVSSPTLTLAPGGSSSLYGPGTSPGVTIGSTNAVRGDFVEFNIASATDFGYVSFQTNVVDEAASFMVQAFGADGELVGESAPWVIDDVNYYSMVYLNGHNRPAQGYIENDVNNTPPIRSTAYQTVDAAPVNILCEVVSVGAGVSVELVSPVNATVTIAVVDVNHYMLHTPIELTCVADVPSSIDLKLADIFWEGVSYTGGGVICVYGSQTLVTNDVTSSRLIPLTSLPVGVSIRAYSGPARPIATKTSIPVDIPVDDVVTFEYNGQPGEYKWYSFTTLEPINNFKVNTLASNPDSDTSIGLYSQDGWLIASNDDANPDENNYLSAITANIQAGTYYVGVAGYGTTWASDAFPVVEFGTFGGEIGTNVILTIAPPPRVTIVPANSGNIFAGYGDMTFVLSCLEHTYDHTFRCRFLNHDGSAVRVTSDLNANAQQYPRGGFRTNNSFTSIVELAKIGDWVDIAYDNQAGCFQVVASGGGKQGWYGAVQARGSLNEGGRITYLKTGQDVALFGELSNLANTTELKIEFDSLLNDNVLVSTSPNGLYEVSFSVGLSTVYENVGTSSWLVGIMFANDPDQTDSKCSTIVQHTSRGGVDSSTATAIGIVEPMIGDAWVVTISSIDNPTNHYIHVNSCEVRIRKIENKTVFSVKVMN